MRAAVATVGVVIGFAVGCAGSVDQGHEASSAVTPAAPAAKPGHLPFPFTADEIRAEWVDGLELTIRRWTTGAEAFEKWTVVSSDSEGAEIESVIYGADGEAMGTPAVQRSTWLQLRDHAAFPEAHATRAEVRRETALGTHDGWLYTVTDPTTGAVNELFFAEALPGAPVFVHVYRDGELVEIFEQVERRRPPNG